MQFCRMLRVLALVLSGLICAQAVFAAEPDISFEADSLRVRCLASQRVSGLLGPLPRCVGNQSSAL